MNGSKKNFSIFKIFLVSAILTIFLISIFTIEEVISNSEKKALIVQTSKYRIATQYFMQKFHAVPGDLKQTQLFGLSKQNTDGDGDNLINDSSKKIRQADGEIVNFWFHLSNSGFIDEKFDGKTGKNAKIGSTFPISKLGQNVGIVAFGSDGKNYFQIGFNLATDEKIFMKDASLKADEAEDFDRKIDDGDPARGFVVAAGGENLNFLQNPKCKNKNSYNIQSDEAFCQLRIELFIN